MEEYKFITAVSMPCTKEQAEEISEKLKELGYSHITLHGWKDHSEANKICTIKNEFAFSGGNSTSYSYSLKLESYKPELFLGLAAMTDRDVGIPQEWWTYIAENNEAFLKGYLYKCVHFNDENTPVFIGIHNLHASGSMIGLNEYFRKSTKEEIIDYFSKPIAISKETMEATNQQLNELAKPPKHVAHLSFNELNKVGNPDQLYKLKEEVKKYWHGNLTNGKYTISEWDAVGWSEEALEPVESRIEIELNSIDDAWLRIKGKAPTDQQLRDIEHLLNEEYGEIEGVANVIYLYLTYIDKCSHSGRPPEHFKVWLREIHK